MKKTYLETIKDEIDNNYFQNEIIKIFDAEIINKNIKRNTNIAFSLLGVFSLIGIVLLCLIGVVKSFNNSQIIFGVSGLLSFIIGIFSIFLAPLFNFKIIHKSFETKYNYQEQNNFLYLALQNLSDINVLKIYIDDENHLTFEINYRNNSYKLIYFNDKLNILLLENNELIHEIKTTHNLNQLIKVYYSDLDKTTFTSLNSFSLCMEIKIKKFAKLIVTDLINCIGEK